jgi:hypothetical protein
MISKSWSWKPDKLTRKLLSHGEKRLKELREANAKKYEDLYRESHPTRKTLLIP